MTFQQGPKPPKLWGGFNAVGVAGVRALHQADDRIAPFLKKMNGDSISYKRNGFDEVVNTAAVAPYLIGRYFVFYAPESINLIIEATVSPEDHVAKARVGGVQINGDGGRGLRNISVNTYTPFAGDGLVLHTVADRGDGASTTQTWMVVESVNGGDEHYASDARKGQSVSYVTSAVTGLGPQDLSFSVWACGWGDDDTRYRFGLTTMVPNDPLNPLLTRVPAAAYGSTGLRALTSVGFPAYTDRNHFDFLTFVVGRGKLQALVFADNLFYASSTPNLTLPYAAPYLAYSNDHGESWSTTSVAWLTPLLCPSGFDVFLKNRQMEFMAKHATITYVGNGKTLLFIPNAYVSGPDSDPIFAPAMLLGDGTSYSRISWPPDTWEVPYTGVPSAFETVHTNVVGFSLNKEARAGHHGFGDGCFYVWVKKDGVGQIMFTHDYGSSWLFAAIPPTLGTVAGAVITPYEGPDKLGKIIFASPDYDTNRLSFYSVGGDFAEFKDMGPVLKAAGDLIPNANQPYNYFFVNYGGLRYRPYVFPAYPKEFEKP